MRRSRWDLALIAFGLISLTLIIAAQPAAAICNPLRPTTYLGSKYQAGVESVNAGSQQLVGGATIEYYNSYVEQASGGATGAWQLATNTYCIDHSRNDQISAVIQGGFAQQLGDTQENVFVEYGPCNGHLNAPMEFPTAPRVTSHFNVTALYLASGGGYGAYSVTQNSTLLFSVALSGNQAWQAGTISVGAETHNENDQGYGGYNLWAQGEFTALAYAYGNTPYGDTLWLVQDEPWLGIQQQSQGFTTWDTACPS